MLRPLVFSSQIAKKLRFVFSNQIVILGEGLGLRDGGLRLFNPGPLRGLQSYSTVIFFAPIGFGLLIGINVKHKFLAYLSN